MHRVRVVVALPLPLFCAKGYRWRRACTPRFDFFAPPCSVFYHLWDRGHRPSFRRLAPIPFAEPQRRSRSRASSAISTQGAEPRPTGCRTSDGWHHAAVVPTARSSNTRLCSASISADLEVVRPGLKMTTTTTKSIFNDASMRMRTTTWKWCARGDGGRRRRGSAPRGRRTPPLAKLTTSVCRGPPLALPPPAPPPRPPRAPSSSWPWSPWPCPPCRIPRVDQS